MKYPFVHYHNKWPISIVCLYLSSNSCCETRYGYKTAVNPKQLAALFLRLLASRTVSRPLRRLSLATRQWRPATAGSKRANAKHGDRNRCRLGNRYVGDERLVLAVGIATVSDNRTAVS